MKARDKTIAVTGGGNGIGRELVLTLLEMGARVVAIDINQDSLNETLNMAGKNSCKLSVHHLNLTEKASVEALPEQIIKRHGSIDGIINNAGIIQPFIKVNDLNFETINRVMDVNFTGALYMIKTFLPYLLKRTEGHIVNISSMGGFLPVPGQSIYGASKSALKLLSEGLYAELKGTGVHVTLIFPGAIATNISSNSGVEIVSTDKIKSLEGAIKTLPAKEAALQIIRAMEKNRYIACVGKDAKFMYLLYRICPKMATNLIAKQMASILG